MNTLNHITLGGVTKYVKDSAGQAMLAPEELTLTAANAHAVGDLFRYDGKLYKASAAIEVGDTINVGVNCEETTVAEMNAVLATKISLPSSPQSGAFLVYNGSNWVAQTLAVWQGGEY